MQTFGRRDYADTFDQMISVFLSRANLFVQIAALMYLPFVGARYLVMPFDVTLTWDMIQTEWLNASHVLYIVLNLEGHVDTFAVVIGQVAISFAVAELYVGRSPSLVDCFGKALPVFWKIALIRFGIMAIGAIFSYLVFGLVLLMHHESSHRLIMWVGDLLYIVLLSAEYILVDLPMCLIVPTMLIERKTMLGGFKRAWVLAKTSRFYLFSQTLTLGFFGFFAFVVSGSLSRMVIFSSVPFLVFYPLRSILVTVMYINIRTELEGLNRDSLELELASEGGRDTSIVDYNPLDTLLVKDPSAAPKEIALTSFEQDLL